MASSKIRMGLVGGGQGAFIGAIHRMAASLDGTIELVCGNFSSDPQRSVSSGQALFLPENRCYSSYQEMFAQEASLPAEQRMQFVAIVTPNHLHMPVAKLALASGFHVLCEKPATLSLAEAQELAGLVKQSGLLYGLTHTYTGYPMIKQARHLVNAGRLGKITKVIVEYSQGWLASNEDEQGKQAAWRLDPSKAGVGGCVGDIGVHAANLAEYVSHASITQICADLTNVVPGRLLDDDANMLLRFDNDARGVLFASQIAVGEENNLRLRVYGTQASLDWSQMEPNSLWLRPRNGAAQLLRAGVGEFCEAASNAMRTPAGHPEGYIEAFANIYQNFANQITAYEQGHSCSNDDFDVPGIDDALKGMRFIESAVHASQSEQKWFTLPREQQKAGEQ